MAAKRDTTGFLYEIRIAVLAAIIWALLGLASTSIAGPVVDAVWLTIRVTIVAVAGFLATHRGKFGLWHAAWAGALVMFADHVLVKGVAFAAESEFEAVGGVVLSYLM